MIIVYLCIFNNKTSSLGPELDAIVLDVLLFTLSARHFIERESSARAHILHLYTQFYFISDKRLLCIYYYYSHRRHLLFDAYVCACCVCCGCYSVSVFADSFTNCVNGYHTKEQTRACEGAKCRRCPSYEILLQNHNRIEKYFALYYPFSHSLQRALNVI